MLRITARTLAFAPLGEVAQLVEHTTENRGVASSILALATTGSRPQATALPNLIDFRLLFLSPV
jgi:hypothetical protein